MPYFDTCDGLRHLRTCPSRERATSNPVCAHAPQRRRLMNLRAARCCGCGGRSGRSGAGEQGCNVNSAPPIRHRPPRTRPHRHRCRSWIHARAMLTATAVTQRAESKWEGQSGGCEGEGEDASRLVRIVWHGRVLVRCARAPTQQSLARLLREEPAARLPQRWVQGWG